MSSSTSPPQSQVSLWKRWVGKIVRARVGVWFKGNIFFWTQQHWYTLKFTELVIALKDMPRFKPDTIPVGRRWQKVPSLTKNPFAFGTFWNRENQCSAMKHHWVDLVHSWVSSMPSSWQTKYAYTCRRIFWGPKLNSSYTFLSVACFYSALLACCFPSSPSQLFSYISPVVFLLHFFLVFFFYIFLEVFYFTFSIFIYSFYISQWKIFYAKRDYLITTRYLFSESKLKYLHRKKPHYGHKLHAFLRSPVVVKNFFFVLIFHHSFHLHPKERILL